MKGWIIIHKNNLSMNFHDRKVYTDFYEAEFEAMRQVREIIRDEVWNWRTYKGLSGHIYCMMPQRWRITSDGFKKSISITSEEFDEAGFMMTKITSVLLKEVIF